MITGFFIGLVLYGVVAVGNTPPAAPPSKYETWESTLKTYPGQECPLLRAGKYKIIKPRRR